MVLIGGVAFAQRAGPLLGRHGQHLAKRNVGAQFDSVLDRVDHARITLADDEPAINEHRLGEELGQAFVGPTGQVGSEPAVGELVEALVLDDIEDATVGKRLGPQGERAAGGVDEEYAAGARAVHAVAGSQGLEVVAPLGEDHHVHRGGGARPQRGQSLGILLVHQVQVPGQLVRLIRGQVGLDVVVADLSLSRPLPPRQLGLALGEDRLDTKQRGEKHDRHHSQSAPACDSANHAWILRPVAATACAQKHSLIGQNPVRPRGGRGEGSRWVPQGVPPHQHC